eukprot:CAMPEP_0183716152 /NCGR_PEP_ID=MMETSP0737-20130205/10158_1 /TAXON_ID=385413 /ORGANISM="Thalassiosira miniscula, Strain CCMP1093" /LENGTH=628 /DNA_ID=CAMNT_0025945371 /DNA_START=41 /DNA_END=1924 /DNA_ORIENTATION=+
MKSLSPHTLLLLLCATTPLLASGSEDTPFTTLPTLRWASTGGGWRAHFACIGFANLFAQKPHLDILSKISAISTTSGASWFSTQLFYSQEFYDRVVLAEDSQALYDFVVEWMKAYGEMLTAAIDSHQSTEDESACANIANADDRLKNKELVADLCSTLAYFDGDWAKFVDYMLKKAAQAYGDDDFANQMAGSDNRIVAMQGTDLLIQAALAPNSRSRATDTAVYLGPDESSVYTVPISTAYVVNASGAHYEYGTGSSSNNMSVKTSYTSSSHSFSDWEDFHLYPGRNGTAVIDGEGFAENSDNKLFSPAFGGGDASTVIQVAAISSAAVGTESPIIPSTFTHDDSRGRYDIESGGGGFVELSLHDQKVARGDNATLLDKFVVCSQWPNPCSDTDGMFLDGWISDNPAFAINVGQYHISGGDLSETVKVILTNTNQAWPTDVKDDPFQPLQILQYYESPVNKGAEPGSFNWPQGMYVPYQSPQVFSDFMDFPTLNSLLEPIPGSNMTTAILNGTTVDNPVFGVRAGQQVEIFLINLNEPITTYVATPGMVQSYTEPLASMTKAIADNEELAKRIKAFVEPLPSDGDGDGDGSDGDGEGDGQSPSSKNAGHSYLQMGVYPAAAVLFHFGW